MSNQEFIEYFRSFYGPDSVLYPAQRAINDADINQAVSQIDDFAGDSFDREKVRDLVFSPIEIQNIYEKACTS